MSWNSINPFPSGVQKVTAGSNVSVTGTITNPVVNATSGGVTALTAGSNISLSGSTGNVTISATSSGGGGMGYSNINALVGGTKYVTVVPNTIYNCAVYSLIYLQAQGVTWANGDTIIVNVLNSGGTVIFQGKTTTTNLPANPTGPVTIMCTTSTTPYSFTVSYGGFQTMWSN